MASADAALGTVPVKRTSADPQAPKIDAPKWSAEFIDGEDLLGNALPVDTGGEWPLPPVSPPPCADKENVWPPAGHDSARTDDGAPFRAASAEVPGAPVNAAQRSGVRYLGASDGRASADIVANSDPDGFEDGARFDFASSAAALRMEALSPLKPRQTVFNFNRAFAAGVNAGAGGSGEYSPHSDALELLVEDGCSGSPLVGSASPTETPPSDSSDGLGRLGPPLPALIEARAGGRGDVPTRATTDLLPERAASRPRLGEGAARAVTDARPAPSRRPRRSRMRMPSASSNY
jgi:hypothetical protein